MGVNTDCRDENIGKKSHFQQLKNALLAIKDDILLNEELRRFVYYVNEGTPVFSNLSFHIYQRKMDTMNGYDILERIYEDSIELKLNIMEASNAEEQYYDNNDKEA